MRSTDCEAVAVLLQQLPPANARGRGAPDGMSSALVPVTVDGETLYRLVLVPGLPPGRDRRLARAPGLGVGRGALPPRSSPRQPHEWGGGGRVGASAQDPR